MIILRDRHNLGPNSVIVISSVVLVVLLVVPLFVPKPSTRGMDIERRKKEARLRVDTDTATDRLSNVRAQIRTQTWPRPEQQIPPQALAKVTSLVKARGLTLVAFRPQRRQDDGPLPMLPFLLTVDGAYPKVVALARDLEAPTNKLAVSLVQVASADAASDRVTASIGLVAYLAPEESTNG